MRFLGGSFIVKFKIIFVWIISFADHVVKSVKERVRFLGSEYMRNVLNGS